MRTIEDADAAALGQIFGGSPEKVVLELFAARRLERAHFTALRIDPRHDVLDDAILAGGIHVLQHHQDSPFFAGVEALLHLFEPADALREERLDLLAIVAAGS